MIDREQREAPRPRIVVADDSEDVRDLIALVLRLHGFDAVGAADGEEALGLVLSEGADGLVSDLDMTGFDGLRLCRVLRALRATTALPIVVFTGAGEGDPRLRPLREMAALRILRKPRGLHAIAPALIEMMPTVLTGRRVRTAGSLTSPGPSLSAP